VRLSALRVGGALPPGRFLVDTRAVVRLEGIDKLKKEIRVISSGIEPAIIRLVAYCIKYTTILWNFTQYSLVYVVCLAYCSTLKIKVICSSATSVNKLHGVEIAFLFSATAARTSDLAW
jgi:hypothetical protein